MKRLFRFHHMSGARTQKQRIEFWRGDDQWRASVHLHWNWRGQSHWVCIFLPELL